MNFIRPLLIIFFILLFNGYTESKQSPTSSESDPKIKIELIDNSYEIPRLERNFEKLRNADIDSREKITKIIKIADRCYENYNYEAFQKTSDDNEISKWQTLYIEIVDYLLPELVILLESTLEQYRKQITPEFLIANNAVTSLNDTLLIIENILHISRDRNIDNNAELNEKMEELKLEKEQIKQIINYIKNIK
ncbi:hypothetical protein QUF75_17815 [Desulfococcaceae bacterium HSG7]|nr:hypothetical protein [Desulfococcaceae bacterium HSG7]